MNNKNITCTACEGTGKTKIVARVFKEGKFRQEPPVYIDCMRCGGVGELSPEKHDRAERKAKEIADLWCSCEQSSGSSYHPDSVVKHHWTCNDCGKVTQIG